MKTAELAWVFAAGLLLATCEGSGGKRQDKRHVDASVSSDIATVYGDVEVRVCAHGEDVDARVCAPGELRCAGSAVEECLSDGSGWVMKKECSDGNLCTQDSCVDGECVFLQNTCDDGDECTSGVCLGWSGECVFKPNPKAKGCCTQESDCDDGVVETQDLCDVATGTCINMVEELTVKVAYRFGSKGNGPGQLNNPKGLAVLSDGRVVVADSGNNRVLFFSPAGQQLAALEEVGGIALKAPGCVAQAPDERVFICDTGNDRILILGKEGEVEAVWPPLDSGIHLFDQPTDVAVDLAGIAYVINGPGEKFDSGNCIMRLNQKGQVTAMKGKTGEAKGNFDKPSGIAISPAGTLFVTDQGNDRVQVFDDKLNFILAFGESGSDPGKFNGPSDIAMLPDGRFFVVDVGNQRVQLFESCQPDCTGKVCGSDGCQGECGKCPSFAECNAQGLCVGWIGDGGEGCEPHEGPTCGGCGCEKCVCTGEGALDPSLFFQGGDSDPYCCEMAWDEICIDECMYVCGYSCPLPSEWPALEPTFAFVGEWKMAGDAPMVAPLKVAVDSAGFVYVLDTVKAEVVVFEVLLP